jgi:dimethylhistidine N-methyltransferase
MGKTWPRPGTVPDRTPPADSFLSDVLRGLRSSPRQLPCKYFYDDTGSQLFEQICRLDEYYLTRTELAIMQRHAGEMAALLGSRCLLFEYGSGSGAKTHLLLDHLEQPAGYVPIDLATQSLRRTAEVTTARYPGLPVVPLEVDFTCPFEPPAVERPVARRVVYFPGSTIGNFTPAEAVELLQRTARLCGPGGSMLLGADRKKDPAVLHAAYNDRQGVTAAFNLNLLTRINRELAANFALERFWHYAFYAPGEGRIEMHLVSRCRQDVMVADEVFSFAEGETIRTEYSYKYTLDDLEAIAAPAGFALRQLWSDEPNAFSVVYLAVE